MRHANPERELNRIHVDGNQSEKALVSVPAMSTALLEKATGGDGRVDDLLVCRIQNISMKLLMSHHCALAVRQTDKKQTCDFLFGKEVARLWSHPPSVPLCALLSAL